MGGGESDATAFGRRRAKKLLTPSTKYENWLRLVRGGGSLDDHPGASGCQGGRLGGVSGLEAREVLRNLVESEVASSDAFKGRPPRGCDVSPAPLPIK